ncbi:MAG: hypothetical protein H6713_05625 [Myxococcales bacterium]|nr:hypothetical protein [Myxococcales bacterium]
MRRRGLVVVVPWCAVLLSGTLFTCVGAGCGGGGSGDSDSDIDSGAVSSPGVTASTSGSGIDLTNSGGADMKFDMGDGFETDALPGGGGDCWGGGPTGNTPDFSNIWIANSPEGTVSKIDTKSGVELARYRTGPEAVSEPSRTSVGLYGDAVVVNRGGGIVGSPSAGSITKIAARPDDCVDRNNNGVIETSSGAGDVYPWFQDECVVWNHPIPSDHYQHGPRPVAWEGAVGLDGCANANPRVWIGWYDYAANTGRFRRLSSVTGEAEDEVAVPGWSSALAQLSYGPYGGAVDKNLDFWVIGWQQGPLIRIDGDTLDVERVEVPQPPSGQMWTYGMALDQYGNPWIASAGVAASFDAASGQWSFINTGNQSMRGVMVSDADRAYYAVDVGAGLLGGCGLAVIDVKSKSTVAPLVAIPGCVSPVGVSVDVDGFIWLVDQGANQAFKISPQNYAVQLTVTGLNQPYTYSDMTGAGLKLVTFPPVG